MRKRSLSRELALKLLYQQDLRGQFSLEDLDALAEAHVLSETEAFARELAEGCLSCREQIDRIIEQTAENWRLDRMSIVDRNILRLATYELLWRPDTPPKVAINEAIELAKKYSTENSATFVNGVLDRIYSTYAKQHATDSSKDLDADWLDWEQAFEKLAPDPGRRADLHIHSTASDGSLEPEELVRRAAQAGLAAIALADHDTVAGIARAMPQAREAGIILVPAVEMTAYVVTSARPVEQEMHIQGLFIDPSDPQLLSELDRLRRVRSSRIEEMSQKLRALGFQFDADDVLRRADGESVGRPHVAQEMVRRGICTDIREAFERYIGPDGPAYVPKERLSPAEVIRVIHEAGGCAVLAHPGATGNVDEVLPGLVESELDAIEVFSPGHTEEGRQRWQAVAMRFNLAVSGGSDFHGLAKPDIELGQETVSLAEVCELYARARARRSPARPGRHAQ